jgi:hypothetical protein
MGVLIPILLWCGLMTLWLVTPRRPVWQARRHSRATAAALSDLDGFTPASDSEAAATWPWQAAPFHYGTRRSREDAARGELAGRPALSCAYRCIENGVAHWSNVLELRLPTESAALEVFHEPPYTSPSVSLPTSLSVQPTGDATTDRAWQVRYETAAPPAREPVLAVASRLREAPEPFSLRAQGGTLVVWREGGFSSAASAQGCAAAALAAVTAFGAGLPVPAAA